jgi:hypothetical protein
VCCTANNGLIILGRVGHVGKSCYYSYVIVITTRIIDTDSTVDLRCAYKLSEGFAKAYFHKY